MKYGGLMFLFTKSSFSVFFRPSSNSNNRMALLFIGKETNRHINSILIGLHIVRPTAALTGPVEKNG